MRLTDGGVIAIANGMRSLFSLDLSFCSKLTSQSICTLLELRYETLSELRLQECRQLKIAHDPDNDEGNMDRRGGRCVAISSRDGQAILKSLRSPAGRRRFQPGINPAEESNISMLDLRCCGGQPSSQVAFPESDQFVRGMTALQFKQKTPGFFQRPGTLSTLFQFAALHMASL